MVANRLFPTRPLLGIHLAKLSIPEAVKQASQGGLILAPAAPALAQLPEDPLYAEALQAADINLPDSGLAIALMKFMGLGSLPRTSGLGFLDALTKEPPLRRSGQSFWIMPTDSSLRKNLLWLQKRGIIVTSSHYYVAPLYSSQKSIHDTVLLEKIETTKPPYVIVCLGGGVQEKLGFWLKMNLSYRPAIICIGAAIGFLSGEQVRIPQWADRLCLGWLLRCLSHPSRFIPRYTKAFRLVYLVLRYREQSPTPRSL